MIYSGITAMIKKFISNSCLPILISMIKQKQVYAKKIKKTTKKKQNIPKSTNTSENEKMKKYSYEKIEYKNKMLKYEEEKENKVVASNDSKLKKKMAKQSKENIHKKNQFNKIIDSGDCQGIITNNSSKKNQSTSILKTNKQNIQKITQLTSITSFLIQNNILFEPFIHTYILKIFKNQLKIIKNKISSFYSRRLQGVLNDENFHCLAVFVDKNIIDIILNYINEWNKKIAVSNYKKEDYVAYEKSNYENASENESKNYNLEQKRKKFLVNFINLDKTRSVVIYQHLEDKSKFTLLFSNKANAIESMERRNRSRFNGNIIFFGNISENITSQTENDFYDVIKQLKNDVNLKNIQNVKSKFVDVDDVEIKTSISKMRNQYLSLKYEINTNIFEIFKNVHFAIILIVINYNIKLKRKHFSLIIDHLRDLNELKNSQYEWLIESIQDVISTSIIDYLYVKNEKDAIKNDLAFKLRNEFKQYIEKNSPLWILKLSHSL